MIHSLIMHDLSPLDPEDDPGDRSASNQIGQNFCGHTLRKAIYIPHFEGNILLPVIGICISQLVDSDRAVRFLSLR
jgi:hypothetical protein